MITMKIIRKYPKISKFNNFSISVGFESIWVDDEEEFIDLVYRINGTKSDLKGFQKVQDHKINYLIFYGTKEECISKEDELLLKQKDFEKDNYLIKQKARKDAIINKYKLLLETELKENDEFYENEIKDNNLFWDDYPNSIYSENGGYDGIELIIKNALRKEKIKKLIHEENK